MELMDCGTKSRSQETEAWAALAKPPERLRTLVLAVVTLGLITGAAAVMLAVALVTGFMARRLYAEILARGLARTILRLWGIDVVLHAERPFPETQTVYVSNHTSTIDLFVLVTLGLPRTRFFFSGFFRKLVPLGVIASLMGTFFTPSQADRSRRARCFQRAERILRRTGDSVYLSPEGQRVTTGQIGHFNKGAFHLATNLQAPIVPLYIDIPPAVDPGMGIEACPGTVHVYVEPPISTAGWRLEDLDRNRARVRDVFVALHRARRTAVAERSA